jgi:hypothetical protein
MMARQNGLAIARMTGVRREARTTMTPAVYIAVLAFAASPAHAAMGTGGDDWLPWLVIGAIAVLVAGIAIRMILSARFPKGYRKWAAERRGSFDANNEAWDRADEEFRR